MLSSLEIRARNARCLSVLLSCLDLEGRPESTSERTPFADSEADRMARALRNRGQPARAVTVDPQSLRSVAKPTLLLLHTGEARVLLQVARDDAWLEDGVGNKTRCALPHLSAQSELVLELAPRLSPAVRTFARVAARLLAERTSLAQTLAVSGLLIGASLVVPRLVGLGMDTALAFGARQMLLSIVGGIVLMQLSALWLAFLRQRIATGMEARLVHTLCRESFERTVRLPYSTLVARSLGSTMQAHQSTETVARAVTSLLVMPALDGLAALVYAAALCSTAPSVALPVLGAAGLCALAAAAWAAQGAHVRDEELACAEKEHARLHEMLAAMTTLKVLGAEQIGVMRWLGPMLDHRIANLSRGLLETRQALSARALQQAVGVGTFVWGAHACLHGEVSVGTFLTVAVLADAFAGAIVRVATILAPAWAIGREVSRIDTALAGAVESSTLASEAPLPEADAVVFDDVWFRYDDESPWLLAGVSFRVAWAEQHPLLGASGSGKTTTLRLIAGLLRPTRGTVRVMGRDPAKVRDHIAYLPQDARLSAGSILHNLRTFSGADHGDVMRAAMRTGLSAWVSTLPMGFETVVPALGGTLSGGQRQWIALTAAVASRRKLLLLDEAWSQLDRLTRARLRSALAFEGRTVISVAHES